MNVESSRAKTNAKECRIIKIVERIPFHLWMKPTEPCVSVCWLLLVLAVACFGVAFAKYNEEAGISVTAQYSYQLLLLNSLTKSNVHGIVFFFS